MSFPGDLESLQRQLSRLEGERDALRDEVEQARVSYEAAEEAADARVNALVKRTRARRKLIGLAVVLLLALGGGGGYVALTYVEAQTFRGTVTEVQGPAPAIEGERCAVSLEPAYLPYNGQLFVHCGTSRIYGHGSYGKLMCETRGGRAVSCRDDDTIDEGGDPRVTLIPSERVLRIDDGPRWRVTIALDGSD